MRTTPLFVSPLPLFRVRPFSPNSRSFWRALLTGPNGLPNARDICTASPSTIRAGKLFRGATPAALSGLPHAEAAHLLRNSHLIDLRSRDERIEDQPASVTAACGPDFCARERHVGLLNKRRVVWGLARVLGTPKAVVLAAKAVSRPTHARATIVDEMNAGGLILLNRILVEAGSGAIGRALLLVNDGVRNGQVYVYCSAGKDRTGLMAALILTIMGLTEDLIIQDYVRSQHMWEDDSAKDLKPIYCERLRNVGLNPDQWLGAPPEVMGETLAYIKQRFGSVEDYLIRCGFDEEHWDELRLSLSKSYGRTRRLYKKVKA